MQPDIIVIRHSSSGAPHMLTRYVDASIINAGDGANEHPSQGLLDIMTIMEHKGTLSGLKIAIIGDIAHSRVAGSDMIGFTKLGASVYLAGPDTFMPNAVEQLGVTVCRNVEDAVRDADVVMALRIQQERQSDPLIPNLREYARFYGINDSLLKTASKDVLVMHPGPINRGVEMNPDVADGTRSVILDQVTNGVAVRMALLYLVIGGGNEMEKGLEVSSVSILKQARVIDPSADRDEIADVWVCGGKIIEPQDSQPESATVYDLAGKWLVPGLIDMHVHLREPGLEYKETIESGTMAAAAGALPLWPACRIRHL